jgi:hypothetical protein
MPARALIRILHAQAQAMLRERVADAVERVRWGEFLEPSDIFLRIHRDRIAEYAATRTLSRETQ